MNVGHLQALIVTAELGSVTDAARQLSYSLSGISRQLRALEAELGVTLFVRSGGGLTPTQSAVDILPLAVSMVALGDAVSATASRHRPSSGGAVRRDPAAGRAVPAPRPHQ
ncbi:LysR family transcriptional regulator [Nocardioides sp.]|uniref:LysR family transcriptional regulator n=1 Tax=Nocardioides sp. TaxID=35761 RepID=UPI003D0C7EB0